MEGKKVVIEGYHERGRGVAGREDGTWRHSCCYSRTNAQEVASAVTTNVSLLHAGNTPHPRPLSHSHLLSRFLTFFFRTVYHMPSSHLL